MVAAGYKSPVPLKSKVVLIDGLIFQFYRGAPNGISRVWLNLIPRLQRCLREYSIILIRRGQFTSGIAGALEYPFSEYDFSDSSGGDRDADLLSTLVAEVNPVCFLSSYYSRARGCPNILLLHDMIPEVMGEDLTKPAWLAKRKAIEEAASFVTVSESTRNDLQKYYNVGQRKVITAYNGVSVGFKPADRDTVSRFLAMKGIEGEYILLVGGRGQYKDALRFLQAFSTSEYVSKYRIIAVGGEPWLTREEELLRDSMGITYTGWISDSDLALLYSGAFALVYPSRYEGFGLPVAEAMACGCPVILPRHSSLPEVAGEAGVYADPGNTQELEAAIKRVSDKDERVLLIELGFKQSSRFNWENMTGVIEGEIRGIG
jgi:glycosyltransferase involved in cell wall biosynthesis